MTQPPPGYPLPSSGWGPPPGTAGPGGAPYAAPTTSGLAIASLITGLFFWCFVVPGIVSIVLGYVALEQISDSGGRKKGRGLAIAGIVLGWVGLAVAGALVVLWFVSVLVA